jgi:hypothetical protein
MPANQEVDGQATSPSTDLQAATELTNSEQNIKIDEITAIQDSIGRLCLIPSHER